MCAGLHFNDITGQVLVFRKYCAIILNHLVFKYFVHLVHVHGKRRSTLSSQCKVLSINCNLYLQPKSNQISTEGYSRANLYHTVSCLKPSTVRTRRLPSTKGTFAAFLVSVPRSINFLKHGGRSICAILVHNIVLGRLRAAPVRGSDLDLIAWSRY